MKESLIAYYDVLDDLHKEIKKSYSMKKKIYGIRIAQKLQRQENERNGVDMNNIKEQKLHVKRLLKLMK